MQQEVQVVRPWTQYGQYPKQVVVGSSQEIRDVLGTIKSIARSPIPVLVTGETGTGKELIARLIHESSGRLADKFIGINYASLPQEAAHNELFGHREGAYAGACEDTPGAFEAANGGTLFFDEIGDMPPFVQAGILRAVEQQRVYRLGSTKPYDLDFRLIAATNKKLSDEISSGRFRYDLYERLAAVTIELPPLRARIEDISELVEYFLYKYAREEKKIARFDGESIELLTNNYPWPGNVRQLENFVRRAILLHGSAWDPGDTPNMQLQSVEYMIYSNYLSMASEVRPLDKDTTKKVLSMSSPSNGNGLGSGHTMDLPKTTYEPEQAAANAALNPTNGNGQLSVKVEIPDDTTNLAGAIGSAIKIVEKEFISRALNRAKGDISETARILGINAKTLYYKLNRLNLSEQ